MHTNHSKNSSPLSPVGAGVRKAAATFGALLLSTSIVMANDCSEIAAAESAIKREWNQLERDYPILLPTLIRCNDGAADKAGAEKAFYMAVCAGIACTVAGSDVCRDLIMRMLELSARHDVIRRQAQRDC